MKTYTLADAVRDAFERNHPGNRGALTCARCHRRKDREDFRETPWHGRAAACQSCERFTFWDLQGARAQWQLEQARETARGLRRGLRLIRVAQLRARRELHVAGMRRPIR